MHSFSAADNFQNASNHQSTSSAFTLKVLTLDDLDLLMDWRMRVLHDVFDLDPDRFYPELEQANIRYYQETLPSHQHYALMIFAGQTPIGCGALCFQQEMPSPDNTNGKCAYVMNVYTLPQYRNHGAAHTLVQALTEEARRRDCKKIYLEASKSGIPVYQSLGFTEMSGMMKLSHADRKEGDPNE